MTAMEKMLTTNSGEFKDLVDWFKDVSGIQFEVKYTAETRNNEAADTFADMRKCNAVISWRAETDLFYGPLKLVEGK
jgi:UDP-glucose 4-epimerase